MRGPRGNDGSERRLTALTLCVVLGALLSAAPCALAAPVVTTDTAPSFITPHTARVGGTIDPAGTDTTAIVKWGLGGLTGTTLLGETISGFGAQPVIPQDITGLQPSTDYSFVLVGQQGGTQFPGLVKHFRTPAPPVVTTEAPSAVGWNSAVVGGTIDPKNADTEWAVDFWSTDPGHPSRETGVAIPPGTPAGPVSVRLTGLQAGTTYHYRLVVLERGAVTWSGADMDLATRSADAATDVAGALAADPAQVVGATWQSRPPGLVTGELLGGPLAGFPLDGGDFAAMTTGTVDDLDAAGQAALASGDGGGGQIGSRGPGAWDVSVLQVGVQAPAGATCLSFAFRFLSEEPPNLASAYGDAFIAELDESTWTTSGSTISAPRDFAAGPGGRVISVNGLGVAATTPGGAAGTRFDSATAILRASAPVTPGAHTVYLSLFDQGGGDVDSAVLIDRLQFTTTPEGACAGAVVDDSTPIVTGTAGSGIGSALTAAGGVLPTGTSGALAPVIGRQVIGTATHGVVTVTAPGGRTTAVGAGRPIPLGSRVDARHGQVRITAASDASDGRQVGDFSGGTFVVTQERAGPVTTVLRLAEDVGLSSCPRRGRAPVSGRRRPGGRLLHGDVTGRFRVSGQFGAVSSAGGAWLIRDSCAGTLVKVTRGAAAVRDFGRHRTVHLRSGRSHLARP